MQSSNVRISAFISLAIGCGTGGGAVNGLHEGVAGHTSGSSPQSARPQDPCSLEATSKLFVAATQVTFDYAPLYGDALVAASEVIAKGCATAFAGGLTPLADPNQTVLQIAIVQSYKGEHAPGSLLYVMLPRGDLVTVADLEALETALREQPVTVFLSEADEPPRLATGQIPSDVPLYSLTNPQALMLSSSCGIVQPLAPDAPVFDEWVESERALDDAVLDAVEEKRLAKGCRAEPGSILDVASEPAWRAFGAYSEWTDVNGCLVRIDVLAERPGPDHCGWEDTRVIITGTPLGARYSNSADARHYVRDQNGSYGDPTLQAGFDPHATLPSGARDTGFRRGKVELWVDPAGDSAIYLKGPDAIERWPRGDVPSCE